MLSLPARLNPYLACSTVRCVVDRIWRTRVLLGQGVRFLELPVSVARGKDELKAGIMEAGLPMFWIDGELYL